jgi:hypothetical protein
MSNESPAQLLAAVLRVVRPDALIECWVSLVDYHHDGESLSLSPKSKDDLARVVAMLTEEQTDIFDQRLSVALWPDNGVSQDYASVCPSVAYKATPAQILAALVAATGVQV